MCPVSLPSLTVMRSIPSTPSSFLASSSPSPSPGVVHFLVADSQPVNLIATLPTVLALVMVPLLLWPVHVTLTFWTVSSVVGVAGLIAVVKPALTTPECHSYLPLCVSLFARQVAVVNAQRQ